jgi:hypothetical protein
MRGAGCGANARVRQLSRFIGDSVLVTNHAAQVLERLVHCIPCVRVCSSLL